jgi:hypothetical protein
MDLDTDCIDTDCIDADCITKDCINAILKHANYRHRSYNTNLYCSNSYDMNSDRVTDSHVKLNILDNTQECLNNSHPKIAFDYDKDTVNNKILKQESSVTICTVDTIGTI